MKFKFFILASRIGICCVCSYLADRKFNFYSIFSSHLFKYYIRYRNVFTGYLHSCSIFLKFELHFEHSTIIRDEIIADAGKGFVIPKKLYRMSEG